MPSTFLSSVLGDVKIKPTKNRLTKKNHSIFIGINFGDLTQDLYTILTKGNKLWRSD